MKTQMFHHAKIRSSKTRETKNPSKDIITLVPNHLKFQQKPKYRLSKHPHIQNRAIIMT
jgi:hypothetical protein